MRSAAPAPDLFLPVEGARHYREGVVHDGVEEGGGILDEVAAVLSEKLGADRAEDEVPAAQAAPDRPGVDPEADDQRIVDGLQRPAVSRSRA